MPPTPRVFISYAREDGEVFANDLRERLTTAGIPIWQDRVGMEGGRDWWAQIAEALNHVEFLVLVMTPAALRSQTVRREWRQARQQGVCVYPVQAGGAVDLQSLPRWMRSAHHYDLQFEWQKFVNDLDTRCRVARVPFMADDIPPDFVQRPRELDQMVGLLCADPGQSTSNVVALYGIGGAGKSLLARAVCHDNAIQETFDQGVLWVTLGEKLEPHGLTSRLQDLVETLTGSRPGFANLDSASAKFAELIADRRLLIVVDDVWDEQHAQPFLRGGPQCGRLLTTRNINTVPAEAASVIVDVMNLDEALAVLQGGLGVSDAAARAQLRLLAERLGQWALILKLVNGVLRTRLTGIRQPLPQAIAYVTTALQRRGLVAFDQQNPSHRHQAVGSTLAVSLDQLNDEEQARFRELGVFAEDVNIPLATLTQYWGATGGLDELATEELCVRLYQLSLLADLNLTTLPRTVRLHDVVRLYLITTGAAMLNQLHRRLIEAHRPASARWADLPADPGYLWDNLAYHLVESGLVDELLSTVLDLRYLSRKTFLRQSAAAERDLLAAMQHSPSDPEIEPLYRTFAQSVALLNKSPSAGDVAVTLFSRLQHLPALARLLPTFIAALPRPCFVPTHPLADLPHPALLRTLSPPRQDVGRCAVTSDGSAVATLCGPHLVIWDAARGVERARIEVPDRFAAGFESVDWDILLDPLRRLPTFSMAADGSVVVTVSLDARSAEPGALVVWEGLTGKLLQSTPHVSRGGCAANGDASLVLTVGASGSPILWDVNANAVRVQFDCRSTRERPVACLALSDDGDLAVVGAGDELMAFRSGGQAAAWVRKHSGKVTCCAISADGATIVSGTDAQEFKVWSAASGDCRFELHHGDQVDECAICADGSLALSLSTYGALKLWDVVAATERTTLRADHPTPAGGCALSRDGTMAVSTISDGTIHLWDTGSKEQPLRPEGRNSHLCAAAEDTVVVLDYDNGLEVWDAVTASKRLTLHPGANSASMTSDGQMVASAASGVRVWNLANPEVPVLTSEQDEACDMSADGSCLVLGPKSGSLRALRPPTAAKAVELAGSTTEAVAVAPDGLLALASSADGSAKAWDTRTGGPVVTLDGDFTDVLCLAMSADKTRAVAGRRGGSLTIYDLRSGHPLHTLPGNEEWVRGCSITRNSRWLASARSDGSLTLWDLRTGERLCVLHVEGFLFDCAWFADDERIVAAGTRGVYFLRRLDAN